MPVPWIAVGGLVLSNLDKIMSVVKPAFTPKTSAAAASQTELVNQQIAELQAAALASAEQIRNLAAQVKDVVAAVDRYSAAAAEHRVVTRRLSYGALGIAAVALIVATVGAMN